MLLHLPGPSSIALIVNSPKIGVVNDVTAPKVALRHECKHPRVMDQLQVLQWVDMEEQGSSVTQNGAYGKRKDEREAFT